MNETGDLKVTSAPNQDNPLMDVAEVKGTAVLGLDVRDPTHYLKYQNERPDYIEALGKVIHWDQAEKNYQAALG